MSRDVELNKNDESESNRWSDEVEVEEKSKIEGVNFKKHHECINLPVTNSGGRTKLHDSSDEASKLNMGPDGVHNKVN